ncbi:Ig-like domain-containing protein [Pontibacter populi]|uniref:Ig-like domain-containing protein n=1 Tax=Pontibacter populi TaxID=890055 RepID=A0ABV1RVK6_9BACT
MSTKTTFFKTVFRKLFLTLIPSLFVYFAYAHLLVSPPTQELLAQLLPTVGISTNITIDAAGANELEVTHEKVKTSETEMLVGDRISKAITSGVVKLNAQTAATGNGSILLVTSSANPFSDYVSEILLAEGFNGFVKADASSLTSDLLNSYTVVIVGDIPLTDGQVGLLTTWTNAGGALIALSPDAKLAPLLGLTPTGSSQTNQYLLVHANGPGKGIVNQTIQYKGEADLYTVEGATTKIATLYTSASAATNYPAVTMRSVGDLGGTATAFTYDLARSVVYLRQGNPAMAGVENDGTSPIRSNDLYYQNWLDLSKVAIPQADEQQRLLANIILTNSKKPLPRFWYLPRGLKAAVIMTGDDHGNGGTRGRFNQYIAESADNSAEAVADWRAIRGTSYIYSNTPLSDAEAKAFQDQGFEIALHLNTGCNNFTHASLSGNFSTQLADFKTEFPSIAKPETNRNHCIAWSDWDSNPKVESANGIRLDANYYYWPEAWIQDRPGLFTGSGMPMRFATVNGETIDCYQVATQMTDESGQTMSKHIDALIQNALGPEGYYGTFCANMHTDAISSSGSDAIIASAKASNVPVISSKQLLTWLDGRNGSAFSNMTWNGSVLNFEVSVGGGAKSLEGMLPVTERTGRLISLTVNGSNVSFRNETIKGIEYAVFRTTPGTYVATYDAAAEPNKAPLVSITSPQNNDKIQAPGNITIVADASDADGTVSQVEFFQGSKSIGVDTDESDGWSFAWNNVDAASYSLTAKATDNSGSTSTSEVVTITVTATCPCTVFSASAAPASAENFFKNGNPIQLGMRFRASEDGMVTGVRFYKHADNTGTNTGLLYSNTGEELARVTFANVTATGWQQANFTTPVAIKAGTTYVISYHTASGDYAGTNFAFFNTSISRGPLTALALGTDGANGVYIESATPAFPTQSFKETNYWVDVVFDNGTTPPGGNTPPTIAITEPANNATYKAPASIVLKANAADTDGTITKVEFFNGDTKLGEDATSPYEFNWTNVTAGNYSITAKATDNSAGVTTSAAVTIKVSAECPCSVFTSADVPTLTGLNDNAGPTQLGMRFRSEVDGYVTGVRYYKDAQNTGGNTGLLYSNAGEELARVTFANETASGWQEAKFATPVAIKAATTYVISYHTASGYYTAKGEDLNTAKVRSPLKALANNEDGPNGVFGYTTNPTFPTRNYNGGNYFVDVVFNTTVAPSENTPPTVTITAPTNNANFTAPATINLAATASDNGSVAKVEFFNGDNLIGEDATSPYEYSWTNVAAGNYSITAKATDNEGAVTQSQAVTINVTAVTNPGTTLSIKAENDLPGNPASEWQINQAGDMSIQGFATDMSYNRGETARFKIKTDASAYSINIYRLGYYQGNGARLQGTATITATLPQSQPACKTDPATGLVDCGNWNESATWAIPANAVSGVYIAKLNKAGGGSSHIVFIVRDDASRSDLFFQTSDATWQAYNVYGDNNNGRSLYAGAGGKAVKVSYNRPFVTRSGGGGGGPEEDWLFNAEYPMIRWLEANGYDVSYTTNVDSDRRGELIANHKVFLSVGHDEYWSGAHRKHVTDARNNGTNLAFFSGNEVYWKTRWENSIDGNGVSHRTLVCYKEGGTGENTCQGECDPSSEWTGLWRSGCGTSSTDACSPENELTGQISWAENTAPIQVSSDYKNLRFWRNTSVASLGAGGSVTLTQGTIGYEWNPEQEQFRATYPAGRILLSKTIVDGKVHHLSLYKHSSGAFVFGAGTVQWSWGLDSNHDRGSAPASPVMQQATVNLFADMGVQPENLQSGLVPATATTDSQAPVAAISSPAANATLPVGKAATITGTATDAGTVAGVEVSTDGGTTWRLATGTASWAFAWTPTIQGPAVISVRSFDDSGNLSTPVTLNVTIGEPGPIACPCTIFLPTEGVDSKPEKDNDTGIQLGMKFRSVVDGFVTGVRFYKNAADIGSHKGFLYSTTGEILAEVSYVNETASGWQEAQFATPVAIKAGTTYVISYHSSAGYYTATGGGLSTAIERNPLIGLADKTDGANGVYLYTAQPAYPTETFGSANYWVDVVFNTTGAPTENTPPTIAITTPANNATFTAPATINIAATASDNGSVAKVEFYNGEVKLGEDLTSPYEFSWTNVAAGNYSITAIATDDKNATTTSAKVDVLVNAVANQLPVVSISAPVNGATFTAPATVAITANATDDDGTIVKVEFFNGETKLGEDATSPYEFSWPSVTAGNYSIIAKATDNKDAVTASDAVSFTVNAPINTPPTVALTAPADNQSFVAPATINMAANASDNSSVTKVEFYNGESKIGEDATAPYEYSWSGVAAGTYQLTAKATDDQNAVTASAIINVTVTAAVNKLPAISISAPTDGSTFTVPATIAITATATDEDGEISKVEFFNGNTKLGEDTAAPYEYTMTSVIAGNYSITAKATDDKNGVTVSAKVDVSVNEAANKLPAISISAPTDGSTFTAPATIAITAIATDEDGSISKVEFYNGENYLGEDVTSPYEFSWTNVAAGNYKITAKATDNKGGVTTSEVVNAAVNEAVNKLPVVSISSPATGSTFTAPATIAIAAQASDDDGTISKVEFYNGETKLGEDATSPYAYSWSGVVSGSYTIMAKAIDNKGGETTSAAVNLRVADPVNELPVVSISSPANGATFIAPATIAIAASASDADGTISKVEFYEGSTRKLGEGTKVAENWSFNWSNVDAGTYALTVKATDNDGGVSTSAVVNIEVTVPVNKVPVVSNAIPDQNATVGTSFNYTFAANTFSDPDGDALTYSAALADRSALPAWLSFTAATRTFSGTPPVGAPASLLISVTASDGRGGSVSDGFTLNISKPANQAPVLQAIGEKQVAEGSTLSFTAKASDPDVPANTLTFTLTDAPAGAAINAASGAFAWTPGENQSGKHTFKVKVTDNGTPALSDEETITVTVTETNTAPVLRLAVAPASVNELVAFSLQASATDADVPANTLAFALVKAPAGATINATSGLLTWTPTEAQGNGSSYEFTVQVSDGVLSDAETFTVIVREVNVAPVLAAISNKTVNAGSALTFRASATDADLPANKLVYGLAGAPSGATINAETGAFTWTPTNSHAGEHSFNVVVSDGLVRDVESVTVKVNAVNTAPVLAEIGTLSINEQSKLAFPV